jgi:hypothetical protein
VCSRCWHIKILVEDSRIGVHNIENPEILKRVNAFVGSIANGEYIKPQQAVRSIKRKVK